MAVEVVEQVEALAAVLTGLPAALVNVWKLKSGQYGHVCAAAAANLRRCSPPSHSGPSHPSGQAHWNALTPSMQVPPLRQGEDAQSLMSVGRRGERRRALALC